MQVKWHATCRRKVDSRRYSALLLSQIKQSLLESIIFHTSCFMFSHRACTPTEHSVAIADGNSDE